MHQKFTLAALVAIFVLPAFARATPIITVGTVDLQPNTANQPIKVLVSDTGVASTEDIEGATFTAQIAGGSTTGMPAFHSPFTSSIDLITGTVWASHGPDVTTPTDSHSGAQFQTRSVLTDNFGDYINANGVLATIYVDTTGVTSGSYTLRLTGTISTGADTAFFDGFGDTLSAVITNGTIVVPEPACGGLLAFSAIGFLRRREKTKA